MEEVDADDEAVKSDEPQPADPEINNATALLLEDVTKKVEDLPSVLASSMPTLGPSEVSMEVETVVLAPPPPPPLSSPPSPSSPASPMPPSPPPVVIASPQPQNPPVPSSGGPPMAVIGGALAGVLASAVAAAVAGYIILRRGKLLTCSVGANGGSNRAPPEDLDQDIEARILPAMPLLQP